MHAVEETRFLGLECRYIYILSGLSLPRWHPGEGDSRSDHLRVMEETCTNCGSAKICMAEELLVGYSLEGSPKQGKNGGKSHYAEPEESIYRVKIHQ